MIKKKKKKKKKLFIFRQTDYVDDISVNRKKNKNK